MRPPTSCSSTRQYHPAAVHMRTTAVSRCLVAGLPGLPLLTTLLTLTAHTPLTARPPISLPRDGASLNPRTHPDHGAHVLQARVSADADLERPPGVSARLRVNLHASPRHQGHAFGQHRMSEGRVV